MAKQRPNLIEWKRPKSDETDCSKRRRWFSRCGRYELTEAVSKFKGMPTIYYAITLDPLAIIGRHRRRSAAIRTCEDHIRKVLREQRT